MDRELLLAVHRLQFLRTREKLLLLEYLGTLDVLVNMDIPDLAAVIRRPLRVKRESVRTALAEAENDARIIASGSAGCVSFWDAAYPPQLREIYDPPFLLFYRGALPSWDKALVGVVGTRYPTGSGLKAAYESAFDIGSAGFGVVSGLARGIDAAAHSGNIHSGGKTIAVLGNGIDSVYPREHGSLARSIVESGGTLVSEYAPGELPLKYHFPERNRIISGLSRSVLIVQAPKKSGALITADYAIEQGRDVYVHAAGMDGDAGAGTQELAFQGAQILYAASDIFNEWGYPARNRFRHTSASRDILPHPGQKDPGTALAKLMQDELDGRIIRHQGEYFRREMHG